MAVFHVEAELDRIVNDAIQAKASDIHFDAVADGVLVRLRIHGRLVIKEHIGNTGADQLINRIKIESGMDIGEKRLPQDGRWSWQQNLKRLETRLGAGLSGRSDKSDRADRFDRADRSGLADISGIPSNLEKSGKWGQTALWHEASRDDYPNPSYMLRVSSLPSVHGETLVCRLVGNENCYKTLEELGMSEDVYKRVCHLLKRPHGLYLISGPTGSGKTSTLYAMLRLINGVEENVISLENPVEAEIPGAIQVQINPKIGLTFSKALRSVLRQDPDTIMIGEIRDVETAELAVRAALTGHRVLATIHTNDAVGVQERLLDMGIPDYLVRATLVGALAQRLVRIKTADGMGRRAIYELLDLSEKDINWNRLDDYVNPTLESSGKVLLEAGLTTEEELIKAGIY